MTHKEAENWTRNQLRKFGLTWHPDTDANQYNPPITDIGYNEQLKAAHEALGDEIYEIGLNEMEAIQYRQRAVEIGSMQPM